MENKRIRHMISLAFCFNGTEVAYGYDAAGNRMTRTENGETIIYTLGIGDRLASWTGGANFYDAAGNVTRIERNGKPTLDLEWNSQYQLVSVSTNGVFAEGYEYDAIGRRASTTTLEGTTRHVYDNNWQVIADIDDQGNVIASYVWGAGIDNLLAVKISGATYYPLTDMQGTVWGYVDTQNNIVARWQYDAWGNVVEEDIASDAAALASLRYRFQGREWSAATGLINFRMRWYDSETGRWLSKDPIALCGGLNLYVFCGSGPTSRVDPLGCKATGTVINNSSFTIWAKPEDGVKPFKVKPGETATSIDGFVIPDAAPGRVFKVPGSVSVKVDATGEVTADGILDWLVLKLRGGWQNSSFGGKHPDWKPVVRKADAPKKAE